MEMSLEDLMKVKVDTVYGLSRHLQKVTDAPAYITIITADEIRKFGYRTLADILRTVPGLYVTYDRNYSYLGVRGFGPPGDYNSRFLLLGDGHRVNDNIYDQAFLGTEFPVDVDLIDRVEVIRGPNSSLYVASAFLGVINVVTRRPSEVKNLEVSGELASYGTYKARASFGHRFRNGLEVLLSGSYYNSHGEDELYFKEFDTPATHNGITEDTDYDEYRQFFANLSYRNFRLEGVYGSREKGVPTAPFNTLFDDPATRTLDTRAYLDLLYDRNFGSDWGLMARLYYDRYPYEGTYAVDLSLLGGPSRALDKLTGSGQCWGTEFSVSKKLRGRQTLIVGSEYRDNFQQHQTDFIVEPYLSLFDDRRSSDIWAAYAQDEVRLRHDLTLDLGVRHDHYSTFGGTTNPRAALIYRPFEKTTLKFLYGQSFRAPQRL